MHHVLASLHERGILRRIYTQNIDGLEAAAGVPEDQIVECHGSALRTICSHNPEHQLSSLPCLAAMGDLKEAPRCSCGALIRPDIVFFGEQLPTTFHNLSGKDMHECDLLIVVGTGLSVYPVAGLVNRVSSLTPRLLINREAVGPWRMCDANPENYRDVLFEGECDDGAAELQHALGW